MAKIQEFYVDFDLRNHQIISARVENVSVDPTTATADEAGRVVYSTQSSKFFYCTGSAWVAAAKASDVAANTSEITNLKSTVGDSATTGLRGRVAELEKVAGLGGSGEESATLPEQISAIKTDLGTKPEGVTDAFSEIADVKATATAASAQAGTNATAITELKNKTAQIEGVNTTQQEAIDALKTTVGGDSSGLVKDVADLESAVGDASSGLVKDVADLKTAVNTTAPATYATKTELSTLSATVDKKVDAVAGKQLSTEDYTTAEKTKLAGIAEGAEVNLVTDVQTTTNGTTYVTVLDGKVAKIDLSAFALKANLSSALRYMGTVDTTAALPSSAEKGDVYNVTQQFTNDGKVYPAGTNVAWDGTAWDPLGGSVDLSQYYTKIELDNKLDALQGKLTLTASKLVVTDASGSLTTAASPTLTELGYLGGVTSAVQTQLNAKVAKNADITASTTAKLVTYDAKGLVTGGKAIEAADVPALDAAKIASGTFAATRIPNLDAAKIASGTIAADRLPIVCGKADVPAIAADGSYTFSLGLSEVYSATVVVKATGKVVFCDVQIANGSVVVGVSEAVTAAQLELRYVGMKA